MNTILCITLYRNALKKSTGPFYYLYAISLGRLIIGDIIARIRRLTFDVSQQEYTYWVALFPDEYITTEGGPLYICHGGLDPPLHSGHCTFV